MLCLSDDCANFGMQDFVEALSLGRDPVDYRLFRFF